jgi:hypothetical protein
MSKELFTAKLQKNESRTKENEEKKGEKDKIIHIFYYLCNEMNL